MRCSRHRPPPNRELTWFIIQTRALFKVKEGAINTDTGTIGVNWDCPGQPGTRAALPLRISDKDRPLCLSSSGGLSSLCRNERASVPYLLWKLPPQKCGTGRAPPPSLRAAPNRDCLGLWGNDPCPHSGGM